MFDNKNHIIAVFEDNGLTLENFQALLTDVANGNLQDGVTKAEADEKICMMFNKLYGFDHKPSRIEAEKALRQNPYLAFEVIEVVVPNLLQSGWDANPFFMEFVDMKNIARGDENVFVTEEEVILNVAKVNGDHWDMPRQRLGVKESYRLKTEAYAAAVYAEFARLMAGHENWSKLVGAIAKAFTEKINSEIYAAFVGAASQLPTQFQVNIDTASADAGREALIDLISDVERSTGYEPIIVGTKSGLAKLRKLDEINWISNNMKQELYETGKQGLWYGTNLIELKQVNKVNTTEKILDDTKLMILPRTTDNKFIKMVNEGTALVRQISNNVDNQDMSYDYRYIQRFGIAVVIGLKFGVATII